MTAQVAEVPVLTSADVWINHTLTAARKFLKSAVVIDNQPYIFSAKKEAISHPAEVSESGMDEEIEELVIPTEAEFSAAAEDVLAHILDVRKVSDAFAEEGMACAFVLPDDNDTDVESIERRILGAAKISDIVVIDWYLRDNVSVLTLQILEKIAVDDVNERGRMRLICVYTGQQLDNGMFSDVKEAMGKGGIFLDDIPGVPYSARSSNCVVVLLNKSDVGPVELSKILVSRFAVFADGLLPSFALAAIGAIRKNIHHMVTRFGKDLDSAYIANRLISDPPEDVAEMMRELLVSECDSALGIESVADNFLNILPIKIWIDANEAVIVPQVISEGKSVDKRLLLLLLQNGIQQKGVLDEKEEIFKFSGAHRKKVSIALAGTPEKSRVAEYDFARLVVFKREAFGGTKLTGNEGWLPSLTTGTLLRMEMEAGVPAKYYICLTPACDTLRLPGDTPFVFLEAMVNSECFSVIVREENSHDIGLYFERDRPFISTFVFSPNPEIKRVRGEYIKDEGGSPVFNFRTSDGNANFTWLGEIRYARAASEMARLVQNWMRIGISDSEYLRQVERRVF
ncbi:response regulator receiver domain [Pseudomonas mandelii]